MASPKMVKTDIPSIYRRGDRYVVVWRHNGVQHKAFYRTFAEAHEAKEEGADKIAQAAAKD